MSQFSYFKVVKNNAAQLNALLGVAFDGSSADFAITGSYVKYSDTAKTPLQLQIYQNVGDNTPDLPFEGVLTIFGANDATGTGETKLMDLAVNLGSVSPAKPIWTGDLNGGLGIASQRWLVSWKDKTVGVKATLTFIDGQTANATTLGLENSVVIDIPNASKPATLKLELADTATVTTLAQTFTVSYEMSETHKELNNLVKVAVHKFNSAKVAITKPAASTVVLKGNLIKAIDLDKSLTTEKIKIGEPVTTKDMIGLIASTKDEAISIYNALVAGGTYDDLTNSGVNSATAAKAVGIFFMQANAEQAAAVAERAKFTAMRQKTPAQIIAAMQTAGVNIPNLDQFIAQNRANLTDAQRAALFASLGV